MSGGLAAAFAAGAAGWSFSEYALHNWVMHRAKGRNEFSRSHLTHHADPMYFASTAEKAATAAVVLAGLALAGAPALGRAASLSFAAGFAAAYVLYEFIHRRCHTHAPSGPVGRFLRKHHFTHHFADPKLNHGVSTPLWDFAFGTFTRRERVPVPRRHAMPWLLDPATGEIKAEFAGDYVLRGPAGKSEAGRSYREIDRAAAFSNEALPE